MGGIKIPESKERKGHNGTIGAFVAAAECEGKVKEEEKEKKDDTSDQRCAGNGMLGVVRARHDWRLSMARLV